MRIVFCTTLHENTAAVFDAGTIEVNKNLAATRGFRYTLCAVIHELVHWLYWKWNRERHFVGNQTYEQAFTEEVMCYKVQLFCEKLMGLTPTHTNAHNGALSSIKHYQHLLKR